MSRRPMAIQVTSTSRDKHPTSASKRTPSDASAAACVLDIPCLGRPFEVGMLYDCRSDRLIPGMTLWDASSMQQALKKISQKRFQSEVITDDSIANKCSKLGIKGGLKLSCLAGLVNVSGSATYLNEHKLSEQQQARVTLKYHTTTRFEQLTVTVDELETIQTKENAIESCGEATHVVTGVLYGAEAFFVFDTKVLHGETLKFLQDFMEAKVRSLPAIAEGESTDVNETDRFHCTVHSGILFPRRPTTFQDAVKAFSELPKLLENDANIVPKHATLYPLSNFPTAQMTREISEGLIAKTQHVIEGFHELDMKSTDLLQSDNISKLPGFHNQLTRFKESLAEYKSWFINKLADIVPQVRGGKTLEADLGYLFKANDTSPFNLEYLSSWLNGKKKEIGILLKAMQMIPSAHYESDFESLIQDIKYTHVVCFSFTVAGKEDAYLDILTTYLREPDEKQEVSMPKQWHKNNAQVRNLYHQAQQFNEFATTNKKRNKTIFVVTSHIPGRNDSSNNVAVIELYENGEPSHFTPPGKPCKPMKSEVTNDSIQLVWESPESSAQSVQHYTVSYCQVDLPEQWKTVKTLDPNGTITVNGLNASTKYHFMVCAESLAGVSPNSEISNPIDTSEPNIPSRPGKPTITVVKHDSVDLKWAIPESGAEDIRYYTISYRDDLSAAQWKTKKMQGPEKATISGLAENTRYCFKVRAESDFGPSQESETSEPILTDPLPLPGRPGRPTDSKVSPDTIHLKWSSPESGAENVNHYIVTYRQMDDQSAQWVSQKTQGPQTIASISGLTAKALYCFKVQAENEYGPGPESNISEPISTSTPPAPSPPGKPTASEVMNDTLHLTWSCPESGSEYIQCYAVQYRRMDDPSAQWKTMETQGPQSTATVGGLTARAVYCFKVFAKTDYAVSQVSEFSDPIRTSPPPLPGRPGKPFASDMTSDTIHLNWSIPESGAKSIDCYKIAYRRMDEPSASWSTQMTVGTQNNDIITGLTAKAEYRFKVVAENEAGSGPESEMSDSILTTPPPVPEQPGKPTATQVTHDTIHLNWVGAESSAGNVKYYTVSYRQPSELPTQWNTHKTQNPQEKAMITGLAANTLYYFKVCAVNDTGTSLDSEIGEPIQTHQSPPPVKPGQPIVSEVTNDSVCLRWTGPESVTSYTVTYRRMDDPSAQWSTQKTQGPRGLASIRGLTADAVYCFRVRGESESGTSQESELSDPIRTKPPPLPSQPGRPIASNVTHDTVVLTWSGPKSGAERVMHYIVTYRRVDVALTQWKTFQTQGHERIATINDLVAKALYTFKVHAECKTGSSPDSETSDPTRTSSLPPPGRPGKPTPQSVTHDTIQITWASPESSAQYVTSYTIHYCRVSDTSDHWKTKNIKDRQNVLTVTRLAASTKYKFKVRAEGESGHGPESEISDPIETSPPLVAGQPGKPLASKVTHDSIELFWSKPEHGVQGIKSYTIHYRRMDDPSAQWTTQKTRGPEPIMTVCGLTARAVYCFKVQAECQVGNSPMSDMCDPIRTSPLPAPGRPGKPSSYSVTHDGIQLMWASPESGAQYVTSYTVHYCRVSDTSNQWKTKNTQDRQKVLMVASLTSKTNYKFKVYAESENGVSLASEECVIETKQKDRLAERMQRKSKVTTRGPPAIYKLRTQEVSKDENKKIAIHTIGKPDPSQATEERVLMVLGATGAGKSTLINAIVNYIMGVEWEDDFRFKLITDEESHKDQPDSETSQAFSQTRWITAYTFYKEDISRIPYTLTIVDTPGFGDTEGLERDKDITSQIKEFFSMRPPNGIDQLHGIGFVTQSSMARLTPTQKYIFDTILSTFGKDIKENIFMMLTFADGGEPPVMAAIQEFDIPNLDYFEFQNSALFSKERTYINETYWHMGVRSLESFFNDFRSAGAKTLQLTREVLQEREHLEAIIQVLVPQIKAMMCKINQLEQEEDMLKKHTAEIIANEDFQYKAKETHIVKIDLKPGEHDTLCLKCNFTCHYPCYIAKDEQKYNCAAMKRQRGSKGATCGICPGKCSWTHHFNKPYRIDTVEVEVEKTYEDLKQRYQVAQDGKGALEAVVSQIKKELENFEADHYVKIQQAQEVLKRLDEIALRPNPLTEAQYIELLIQSEQREVKPGWENRVKYLETAKEKARLISQLQGCDPKDKPDWLKRVEERRELYELVS